MRTKTLFVCLMLAVTTVFSQGIQFTEGTWQSVKDKAAAENKLIMVDAYADWCVPCKMLAPVLHEIAEENAGTLKVGKINVDEQMELAMRFQVSSIPMLVVFKDGKAVAKSVGYRPKSEIAAMVEGAR